MANNARVLGIVLMHATGTTAGLFDMLRDKVFMLSLLCWLKARFECSQQNWVVDVLAADRVECCAAQMMNWKLETVEKKTSVANYLVLHRFGTVRSIHFSPNIHFVATLNAVLILTKLTSFKPVERWAAYTRGHVKDFSHIWPLTSFCQCTGVLAWLRSPD